MEHTLLQQLVYILIVAGTVAVILLLAGLLLKLKQHHIILRDQAEMSLRKQFMDLQLTIAQHEDLANLYQRGLRGFTGLSDTEQTRFFIISGYAFNHWSEAHHYMKSGLVSAEYWQSVQTLLKDFLQYKGVQEVWNYRKHWYPQDMQALIEKMIKEAPARAKPFYPETAV